MSKNIKRVITYFLYVLFFYIVFYWGVKYGNHLNDIAKSTFRIYPLMIYKSLFPILLGLLIGLPNFINKIKEKGQWKVDWLKLIVVGIPTLYIGLFFILWILGGKINVLLYPRFLNLPLIQYEIFYSLSGFISGYIILDSIDKKMK